MALRLVHKINRLLKINRVKDSNKSFSTENSKIYYVRQLNNVTRSAKQNQERNGEKYTEIREPEYLDETPVVIPSELQDSDVKIRRKFAKSSTQIAITQPLKLPRLANPFPEPVKSLQSETVSDEEKSRMMHEQVKMEARFHLQQHQEMLLQQQKQKGQKQNMESNNDNLKLEQLQDTKYKNCKESKQPTYRKPKEYAEQETACTKPPEKIASNTSKENDVHVKRRRSRTRCHNRRKSHTRAPKYLRHSVHTKHDRKQIREYSTAINPESLTDSEQCDLIIKRLKALYPEYENLKKPILIPGSKQEKEFFKKILQLIGKHKIDIPEKISAPFPSYSEVKTYAHKNTKGNYTNNLNNVTFNSGSVPRFYSTRNLRKTSAPEIKKISKPINKIHKYEFKGFSRSKKNMKKQEAPYSAFSDFREITIEPDNYEMNYMHPSKQKKVYVNTRLYSTATNELEKEAKKKPPCKNPFPPIPECDYERPKKKKKNPDSKKKKKCSSEPDNKKIISKIRAWLNTYKPETENIKISRAQNEEEGRESYVIELCECQEVNSNAEEQSVSEAQNEIVEIIQSPPDKLNVYPGMKKAPFRNLKYKPIKCNEAHAAEMTDPIAVQTKNIPDFVSDSEILVKKPEELKLNDTKLKEKVKISPIQTKIDPFKYTRFESIANKPKETQVNKIDLILNAKLDRDHINKVKEQFRIKPKQNKINEVRKIMKKSDGVPDTPKNFKVINVKNVISDKYKNFKVNDMKSSLPKSCPVVTTYFNDKYESPKKRKKGHDTASKQNCRNKKKRKLPNCDDANKKKKGSPLFIPTMENKSQYLTNISKKTNFKKNANETNYFHLKPQKIDIFSNENETFEPFKLKQQFRKKLVHHQNNIN